MTMPASVDADLAAAHIFHWSKPADRSLCPWRVADLDALKSTLRCMGFHFPGDLSREESAANRSKLMWAEYDCDDKRNRPAMAVGLGYGTAAEFDAMVSALRTQGKVHGFKVAANPGPYNSLRIIG